MSIQQNTNEYENTSTKTQLLEMSFPINRATVPPYIIPLLSALADSPETARYYCDLIKPLQQYDLDHSSNLMGTLAQYLYHSGNVTHASQALYLHRSTLLHRLGRISALTSLDLSDPHVRLALWIAVILAENS